MATKSLAPFYPNPPTEATIPVVSPFMGQGRNKWKALVRNLSPYALILGIAVDTSWLGPFEEDYLEFPAGVQTFTIYPQILPTSGTGQQGVILVTAFDQSSDYDGDFPISLSLPVA